MKIHVFGCVFFMSFPIGEKTQNKTKRKQNNAGKRRKGQEGLTCQQPQDGGAGSAPTLLVLSAGSTRMTDDAVGSVDDNAGSTKAAGVANGSAGSTGATGVEGDTDLDGATIGFVGDAVAASSSVPRASWER